MKNIFNIKTLFFVALTSLVFTSCTDDDYQKEVVDNSVELSAGTADFSNYVAVGNSLTAGYTDGALFIKGQEDSMPNILASKFAMIGGGDFTQPLMDDNIGGFVNTDAEGNFIQEPRMIFNGGSPIRLDVTPTTDFMAGTSGPYNNMGVPGAKVGHLLNPYFGNSNYGNPYFVRMASSSSATVIEDATVQEPTFFSLWIGSNDVLAYAMAGADESIDVITSLVSFQEDYNAVVNAMTGNGAKGVVLNIVDVTTVPFFTTVPFNPVPLDQATADALNAAFAQYNGGVQQVLDGFVAASVISQEMADTEIAKRKIHFVAGDSNAVTIVDENLMDLTAYGVPNYRHATADDLLVLSSKSFIGTQVGGNPLYVNGVSVPLEDKWVLTPEEQQEIKAATDSFNAVIQAVATDKGLAFVDASAMMTQLANGGVSFDEFTLTNQYALGGMFSLDGIHPTARGNAFMANEMLKAIDATYGSTFETSNSLPKAKNFVTLYAETLQ